MNNDNTYDDEDDFIISRTAQKKSMQIYIAIGEELLTLSPSQLSTIPLVKELDDALLVAKKIKVGNALKRQMSFIGKLIRNNNHEDIQTALDRLKQKNATYEHVTKSAEKWRDKILTEPSALSDFIATYSQCDRQKLNQLARNAIKEVKAQESAEQNGTEKTPSKHKKSLFKLIRVVMVEHETE
jgi:ribosome-associated protein